MKHTSTIRLYNRRAIGEKWMMPVKEIVVDESPAGGTQYYVQGYIYNATSQPITGAYITIVWLSNGNPLTEKFKLDSPNYEAWTDLAPDKVGVKFEAKGYASKILSFQSLVDNPDVVLKKPFPLWIILLVVAAVHLYRKKRKKVGAFDTGDVMTITMLIGGILAFDVVKDVLEFLGLWKSKDTKELDHASTDPNNFWNPNFWKTIKPPDKNWTFAFTTSEAQRIGWEIFNAMGAFNDCEDCIIGEMKKCRTKANASFIADVFQQTFDMDLLTFLRGGWWPQDGLSDADVNKINSYIDRLPNY